MPDLRGDIAGLGGATARQNGRALEYVTGAVTLDADAYASLRRRRDGPSEERAILLHELGHLVGLAHVQDRRELMYSKNLGVLNYAAGDLSGLARLGWGKCF